MYIFSVWFTDESNQVTIQHEFQSSWRQSAAPFCDLAAASSFFVGRFPPFEGSLFRAWRSWSRSSGFNPDVSFLSRVCGSKKAKLSKSIIQSSSQSSCKCRDSLKLCHLHHIFVFVHSHLAVLPCAEPLTALDPFQQRKASGPGSCGKSVEFLVRIWDTPTPNKTILQPLLKPLTSYKACQELIHSSSVNPAVSCWNGKEVWSE